ncbi:unnamed protein product [Meloidogyne enterolobii]|uniref:Uncharacterized protein n=1 Tax=Meloidogyne enterolobii TaxID=390850 RepID=A0ACB1AWM5_MELEN
MSMVPLLGKNYFLKCFFKKILRKFILLKNFSFWCSGIIFDFVETVTMVRILLR